MTKLFLLLSFVTHMSLAQNKPPASPDPVQPPIPIPKPFEWTWVRGEDAEELLLKMNWELENSNRNLSNLGQKVGLTAWWIFSYEDEAYQAPKALRMNIKHDGHSDSTPLEIYFTLGYRIDRLFVPLMTLGGILRGVSVRADSPERFVYFYMKTAMIEPNAGQTRFGSTATITCDVCDSAKVILQHHISNLSRYVNNEKYSIAIHFPAKKEDRIEVNAVERR